MQLGVNHLASWRPGDPITMPHGPMSVSTMMSYPEPRSAEDGLAQNQKLTGKLQRYVKRDDFQPDQARDALRAARIRRDN